MCSLGSVLRKPSLRVRQLADAEAPGLSGKQERKCTQRRPHPILVADYGHALVRRSVARAEAQVSAHRVALDLASSGADQVEQPHATPLSDLLAQYRLDSLLPIVVLYLPDRLKADRPARHVR